MHRPVAPALMPTQGAAARRAHSAREQVWRHPARPNRVLYARHALRPKGWRIKPTVSATTLRSGERAHNRSPPPSLVKHGTEELLGGLPVTIGGGWVVARVVGDGEAVVGLIGLDGVDNPGLGERLLQQVLLLVGE